MVLPWLKIIPKKNSWELSLLLLFFVDCQGWKQPQRKNNTTRDYEKRMYYAIHVYIISLFILLCNTWKQRWQIFWLFTPIAQSIFVVVISIAPHALVYTVADIIFNFSYICHINSSTWTCNAFNWYCIELISKKMCSVYQYPFTLETLENVIKPLIV